MTRSLLTLAAFAVAATATAGVIPPIPRIPGDALKPAAKPDETGDDDPAKIAERIAKNTKEAGDKLADQDTGDGTRKTQEQILKDIDALLKKAQEPPPMGGGGGGMPPPMGGDQPMGGGQPKGEGQPKGGGQQQPKGGWRDRAQGGQPKQQPMGGADQQPAKDPNNQPMGAQGQPMNPAGATPGSGQARQLPAMPLDDAITKQVWGHLPERLRQQMSQYYKEQFMPKYADMLRQYYSALAEREKAPRKQ